MKKTAIELFAGVGGFRIGLNDVGLSKDGKAIEKPNFEFLWANQWEPSTKSQDAFDCYKLRFQKGNDNHEFSNVDINLVDKKTIPDFTLLTAGFPCQDYSVARSLSQEKGIKGKKGVLWWQIDEIIRVKKPPFILLENVDRLLKSPSKQRGRDFGVILRCLADNDYSAEWRVINAADYGFPQRRRRVFIFAFKNDTSHAKRLNKFNANEIINEKGIFATSFKINSVAKFKNTNINKKTHKDLVAISDNFEFLFENSGYMTNYLITTAKTTPILKKPTTLGEIVLTENVPEKYFLSKHKEEKFAFLKGAKRIERTSLSGHKYIYSEGSMAFPENLDLPARTMLTSEGTVNRSTHVIVDKKTGKLRILTPIECERLNMFPDNWTNTMSDSKRYFMMGNALVTGIIKKLGKTIELYIELEP